MLSAQGVAPEMVAEPENAFPTVAEVLLEREEDAVSADLNPDGFDLFSGLLAEDSELFAGAEALPNEGEESDGSDPEREDSLQDSLTGEQIHLQPENPLVVPQGLELAASQTLSGSGDIDGDVTSSGTISPGNSPGVQNITGDSKFSREGKVLIEIGGSAAGTQF